MHIGGARQIVMTDGVRAWSSSDRDGRGCSCKNRLRQQVLLDRLPVHAGRLADSYFEQVDVLKRIKVRVIAP